jgi:hypothetical protein
MSELLWKLSGSDYYIIKDCDTKTKDRFGKVGLFVFVIGLLCFFSGVITFYYIFKTLFIAIPFALFFGWMVANIYLVLLGTLAKNPLPHIKNVGAAKVSLAIRLFFLLIIAIIISKPIESFLLSSFTSEKIEEKRIELLSTYGLKLMKYYKGDLNKIQSELTKATKLVYKSDFFIERIRQSNKLPIAWLFTIINVVLFLLPAGLKYFIAENDIYYIKKSKNDKSLIEEHYNQFKINFKNRMFVTTGKVIEFKENYKNPPYNTKPLTENRIFKDEQEFISSIYSSGN